MPVVDRTVPFMGSSVRMADGQFDFAGGVDSSKPPMIKSDLVPNGLRRDQLAWGNNVTFRGGCVAPRPGWKKLCRVVDSGLYQCGYCYDASAKDANLQPYLMLSIGGHIYQVRVDSDNSVIDLSNLYGLANPDDVSIGYMCQGEEFLIIQAGDYVTLPLFWDGASLRRSAGIVCSNNLTQGATFTVPDIGEAVLMTLTAPYSGDVNEKFMIDGYEYQQVTYDQRYRVYGIPNASTEYLPLNFPAETAVSQGANSGLLINPISVGGTDCSHRTYMAIAPNAYAFINLPLAIIGSWASPVPYFNVPSSGACSQYVNARPDALAVPGANQVWMVNLTDTRKGTAITTAGANANELPAAGPMDYYMGRLWYAQGRQYCAGDIVRGGTLGVIGSGTAAYDFRDSILHVTENPIAVGGDGFIVPANSGVITAIKHPANLNTTTGEGPLYIFTSKAVHQMTVPVSRSNWIASDNDNLPVQIVIQDNNGSYGDRGIVSVNGDLYYPSVDGIRSLITAVRYFGTLGNLPISNDVTRALKYNQAGGREYASGIVFDNRLLQTCMPISTPAGIAFQGVLPLDWDLISNVRTVLSGSETSPPPAWEGLWEVPHVLQMFKGVFGAQERAFAVVASSVDGGIDVWEITASDRFDDWDKVLTTGDRRIIWYAESPSWTWQKEFEMKELDGGEVWIDSLYGSTDFQFEYRVDADPCWRFWHQETLCVARTSCEDVKNPVCYPEQPYRDGYKFPIVLPKIPFPACASANRRPSNQGYQFQVRLTVRGHCRIRGWLFFATLRERAPYGGLNC